MKLADEVLCDAKFVQVGLGGRPARASPTRSRTSPPRRRPNGSRSSCAATDGPVLVFVRTKSGADRLARRLAAGGLKAAALHADRTQAQRTQAVEGFRSGRFRVLVATDVAARGLDIDGITHVVNFEVPSNRETYMHRVGTDGTRRRDRHGADARRSGRASRAAGAAALVRDGAAGLTPALSLRT